MIFNLEEVQYQLDEATTRIKKLEELNTALMKNDESLRVELARVNRILAITEERVREHEAHENQTHAVLGKILGTDDTLENVARRAVNRIAELEVVLVEERAKTIMLIEKLKSVANDPDWQSKGLEHDFDWYMAESKKQIESGEPEDEAAIHKKMEELPSAPGAYRPAIREEAIRQLGAKPRSWQITDERKDAIQKSAELFEEDASELRNDPNAPRNAHVCATFDRRRRVMQFGGVLRVWIR